jgi:acetylornithine/succinyldiaminopimelate/putrescine aminotransferase
VENIVRIFQSSSWPPIGQHKEGLQKMGETEVFEKLLDIRKKSGTPLTTGLPDSVIKEFLKKDTSLGLAIMAAADRFDPLSKEFPELRTGNESDLLKSLQSEFVNFYSSDTISPYLPLSAKGPWIVSCFGAVIYDTGGYGMLGLGHDPDGVRELLARPYTMANIMTASFCQKRFTDKIRKHIGSKRKDGCPYEKFICMNSGSESCGVATRISSAYAKRMTDPGGRHEGKKIKMLSLQGSFHGRTLRPAQASDSTLKTYKALALFRDLDNLVTVKPNDLDDLRAAFTRAEKENFFIEIMLMEPVMGEGNPGLGITPEFYQLARELTRDHGSFLLVDSIQAGLRAQGVLSIVDYPGFEELDPPEMETFSKALNAGQFPLSTLAMTAEAAKEYVVGTYGNTMTGNPRGLDIACAVLEQMDDDLARNIQQKGKEFLAALKALKAELPEAVIAEQGTGLLVSLELHKAFPVVGPDAIEVRMRKAGVNVIHGGVNCLRFTPHFKITSDEIRLITDCIRETLIEFQRACA